MPPRQLIIEWVAKAHAGDACPYRAEDVIDALAEIGYPRPAEGTVMTKWQLDATWYADWWLIQNEDYEPKTDGYS